MSDKKYLIDKLHISPGKMSSKWTNNATACNFVVNSSPPNVTYMRQWIGSALVQIMACPQFVTERLFKPVLGYVNWTLILQWNFNQTAKMNRSGLAVEGWRVKYLASAVILLPPGESVNHDTFDNMVLKFAFFSMIALNMCKTCAAVARVDDFIRDYFGVCAQPMRDDFTM